MGMTSFQRIGFKYIGLWTPIVARSLGCLSGSRIAHRSLSLNTISILLRSLVSLKLFALIKVWRQYFWPRLSLLSAKPQNLIFSSKRHGHMALPQRTKESRGGGEPWLIN